jgi:hypothetical protein
MAGLLGNGPSRRFKVYQTDFPAVFRFNGKLYQEFRDVDVEQSLFIEIKEEDAERLLHVNGH